MRTTIISAALAAVAVGASAFAAAPANAATTTTDTPSWPSSVQGRPADLKAGATSGDYLYHDKHGFHLRVTHPGDERRTFSGTIHANTAMVVHRVKLEKGDTVKVSKDHRTVAFVFHNYGKIDGIDFMTHSATKVRMSHLHVGKSAQSASTVYLGSVKTNPADIPFTLVKES